MNKHSFTEEDKAKFVELLNFIAKKANFNVNTDEVIGYYKLLQYAQHNILAKIDANILEIKKIVSNPPKEDK
jgi:hypothetical protein